MEAGRFWIHLDELVAGSQIVIDRPKGSADSRFPDYVYPYDYGYLAGTASGDGHGIDVWIGSCPTRRPTAVICSVDLRKRDSEIKVLIGCTDGEAEEILGAHNFGGRSGLLIVRPDEPSL